MVLSRRRATRNTEPKAHKQQLIDMPLDVLIEIFSFLEPLDLLCLSRTTKVLRAFLLSRRRSSALWKIAISNVKGFPPCPDHMSAPAYTHLAFVPVCHGCFCPCETVQWELRMRCCPTCFQKMTIPRSVASHHTTLHVLDLPVASHSYTLDDSGLDIRVVIEPGVHPDWWFSLSDWKVAKSRKRPRNVSREEFLAQQNDFWGPIRRHGRLCQDWEYGRLKKKATQLLIVRKQRVKYIKDRLEGLGWTELQLGSSIYRDNRFLKLPQVSKLEPLRHAEWAKIRPELITWAQGVHSDLVRSNRVSTFLSASQSIQLELRNDTSLKVQPRGIDIAMLPAVRSMFESHINSEMSYDNLKKKLFRVLLRAAGKWSSDAVEELEQFAREQLGLSPLSKPSRLPSVIFQCRSCFRGGRRRERLMFDEALSHRHLYEEQRNEEQREDTREMSSYDRFVMMYGTHPRDIQVLRVDVPVSRRVENLIRRMGQNPNRVTYDELRRSTVNVVCGLCRSQAATTRMDFEHAFKHCLSTHLGNKETEVWTRVSARDSK